MTFDLQRVARALGQVATSVHGLVTGWSVDSRTIEYGDLFFALAGERHDGHHYLFDAFRAGAAAAVVSTPSGFGAEIVVPDTLEALQRAATWVRREWGGRVVAITGSAGKTTTKEIVAQLLELEAPTGKTQGNLNNHVGLPLSILRLPEETRVAAIEIAMNHPGEIKQLAAIAQPHVAVVTNVGFAHAGFFESIEQVALAKRELIESLHRDGIAVLNADDPRVAAFRDIHPGPVISFGLSPSAGVRAEEVEFMPQGVRFRVEGTRFESSLTGRHGLMNVLAGIAAARAFGIAPARLVEAVRALAPVAMRGERLTHSGVTVINDCYNSNPEAVQTMLDELRDAPARRRVAVLGEMLELGQWSEALHRDVGRHAAECGIDVLVGIRGAARRMVEEAVRSGVPADAAFFYDEPAPAGDFLRGFLKAGDVVLFKGSRGVHVEIALNRYVA
jgi:UDP-N-acetylmuramoyl-tripeptide--D-alanyl-D-alanine ligase